MFGGNAQNPYELVRFLDRMLGIPTHTWVPSLMPVRAKERIGLRTTMLWAELPGDSGGACPWEVDITVVDVPES